MTYFTANLTKMNWQKFICICFIMFFLQSLSDYDNVPNENHANWTTTSCDFSASQYRSPLLKSWRHCERGVSSATTASRSEQLFSLQHNKHTHLSAVRSIKQPAMQRRDEELGMNRLHRTDRQLSKAL